MALKNKKKVFKRTGTGLAIGFGVLLAVSSTASIISLENVNMLENRYNEAVYEFMKTDDFKQYTGRRGDEYYDAYKKGIITAEEFSKKIEDLKSIEYIYQNRNEITNSETAMDLEEKYNEYKTTSDKHNIMAISSISISGVGCAAGIIMNVLNNDKFDEDEYEDVM